MIPLTFPNKELQGMLTFSDVDKELQGMLTSSDVISTVPCILTDDASMDLDIGVLWKLRQQQKHRSSHHIFTLFVTLFCWKKFHTVYIITIVQCAL